MIALRNTIFQKILENIGAIFTGAYLHYGEVPEKTIAERNIAEGVKLRRQRLDINDKKKENINNEFSLLQLFKPRHYAQKIKRCK